jgi:hypothetical protein
VIAGGTAGAVGPEVNVAKPLAGQIVYLYAFDVANEIALGKVRELLAEKPVPYELRKDHTTPKDIPIYRPLAIEPRPAVRAADGGALRVIIRVYEVGVVSVAVYAPFEADALAELMPRHKPTLEDGRTFDALARGLCVQCMDGLRPAMLRAAAPSEPEAYTVFCLTRIDGAADVNAWLAEHRRAVAGLLSETEPSRLSEAQVAEAFRFHRSFENTDAVVIDWDAALAVDLAGYVDDVLYVLEIANLQIEEFRMMDAKLDRYLDRAYDDLGRRRFGLLGAQSAVLRMLRTFRLDVAKLADEVTHIAKFSGDWYLARVYLGARERFHLDAWRAGVEHRLGQLDTLYTVVNSDVYEQRMLWLEIIIVVFFAVDLAAILFLKT